MKEKIIHDIKDLIVANNFKAFFIIDSDKERVFTSKNVPYERYYTKSKKLISNSLFLYRQPKRLAKNRKFNIYGGGIIYKLEYKGEECTAYIKNGFELVEPIDEDNEHLKNMKWTSKVKTSGWDHFWSQFGINEINKEDMINIMKKSKIVYRKDQSNLQTTREYNDSVFDDTKIVADKFLEEANIRNTRSNRQMDNRFYIRDLVNRLIANLETESLKYQGIDDRCKVEILSRMQRVEKGCDIISYEKDDESEANARAIYIAVKISPSGQTRLTHVSRRELEMFSNPNFRLYTVYNLDPETGKFDLHVDKGEDLLKNYDFEPVIFNARLKNRRKENE